MSVERRGAAIEIAHLNKTYGNGSAALLALDDIDLRVAPGEFLCIVGPSGCGKSTLLRILAGLDQQTQRQHRGRGRRLGGPERHGVPGRAGCFPG